MLDVAINEKATERAVVRQSVQDVPTAAENASPSFFSLPIFRGPILPAWGTRQRERVLRDYSRHEYNWLGQAAFAGLTKKWAAAPWEISGQRRVRYFQDVLRGADFGAGWTRFLEKVGYDFLRQDGGAYVEIIAPGNPLRPPTGPATGLAYLDSLHCVPTGDPEFPVIYFSRKGTKHLLHASRVRQLVDMPDGDQNNPGYGLCALSRAISIVLQQIYMNRYTNISLDDKPKPGYIVARNINEPKRDAAFQRFAQEQSADEPPPYGRTVWFYSVDPAYEADLKWLAFSEAPEKFDYKQYTELHVNAWAAALGVDVQEIWQLQSGNLGSGQQSQVLHAKSQGRTYGAFLTNLERVLNDVLPESLTFEFKVRDPYEAQERAQSAGLWASFVSNVGDNLTADEKRRLLANQVEAVKDAITDENGEIVRLQDADVQPEQEQIADDSAPNSDTAPVGDAQTADSEKAIADTRGEFLSVFKDLVSAVLDGDVNRRRAGVVMRGQLSRLGRKAMLDGLSEGGIDELGDDDQARLLVWVADQSRFVTNFLDSLVANGLTPAQIDQHAELWAGKSLEEAHRLGQLSADANGLYQWVNGIADHCPSCVKMNGQVHRLSTYVRKGIVPKATVLKCTFGCQCRLVKTTGKASGRWL